MWGKAEWSSSPVRHRCFSDSGSHLHPNLFWSILLSSHFYRNWFQNENTGNRWCQGTSTDMVSWWCNVFVLCLVMVCCWCVSCFFFCAGTQLVRNVIRLLPNSTTGGRRWSLHIYHHWSLVASMGRGSIQTLIILSCGLLCRESSLCTTSQTSHLFSTWPSGSVMWMK